MTLANAVARRGRLAMASGSAARMAAARAQETVIALPFRFSDMGAIIGVCSPQTPRFTAKGRGASIWAPSSAPIATLSRILAHDASRERSTDRPSASKNPFSRATTRGAQQFNAMKPSRSLVRSRLI